MCILSALPRGTSTRTTVWTRAGRRRSAGRGGKRLQLPPAVALRSGPVQEGEEVQESVEEGGYVYRLQLLALPQGTSTLTTVWARAGRRRNTGREEEDRYVYHQ